MLIIYIHDLHVSEDFSLSLAFFNSLKIEVEAVDGFIFLLSRESIIWFIFSLFPAEDSN